MPPCAVHHGRAPRVSSSSAPSEQSRPTPARPHRRPARHPARSTQENSPLPMPGAPSSTWSRHAHEPMSAPSKPPPHTAHAPPAAPSHGARLQSADLDDSSTRVPTTRTQATTAPGARNALDMWPSVQEHHLRSQPANTPAPPDARPNEHTSRGRLASFPTPTAPPTTPSTAVDLALHPRTEPPDHPLDEYATCLQRCPTELLLSTNRIGHESRARACVPRLELPPESWRVWLGCVG